ncbi:MAG: hypothetical protein JXD23_09680 [Spirochaetales bacterium]|nr:hypothetical protein [Spirochaetales bacterium]
MKRICVVVAVLIAFAVFGCTTTDGGARRDPTKGPTNEKVAAPVTIIDHQYRGLKNVPDWVTMSQGELDRQPEFKGSVVFKEVFQSKDLNVAKTMADDFSVSAQLSKFISARLQTKFSGALVGSNDGSDVYFEKVVKYIAESTISGARRYADYWLQRRYVNDDGTDKDVFEYYILVQVPQTELKKAVARAFDQTPAETENEKRAREKVKKIMDDEEEW